MKEYTYALPKSIINEVFRQPEKSLKFSTHWMINPYTTNILQYAIDYSLHWEKTYNRNYWFELYKQYENAD